MQHDQIVSIGSNDVASRLELRREGRLLYMIAYRTEEDGHDQVVHPLQQPPLGFRPVGRPPSRGMNRASPCGVVVRGAGGRPW